MDYKSEIESILSRIIIVYDLDLEKYVGATSARIDDHYHMCKFIMECQKTLADDNIESTITNLFYEAKETFIPSLKSEITYDRVVNHLLEHEASDFNELIGIAREIDKVYKHFNDKVRSKHLAGLKGHSIFKDDTFDETSLFNNVSLVLDAALNKGLFKLHVYKKGNAEIAKGQKYFIYPNMGMSYSLQEWLKWLESQMDFKPENDEAVVTCFMKMEYESTNFSYFVIAIHKGDSIWIATDQINFYNPANKSGQAARNNGRRSTEDRLSHIGLPYELAEKLDEIRAENGTLTTKDYCERIDINKDYEKYKKDTNFGSFESYGTRRKHFLKFFEDQLNKHKIDYTAAEVHVDSTWDRHTIGKAHFQGVHVASYMHDNGLVMIYRNPEVLKYSISKWDVECKLYLKYLIDRLLFGLRDSPKLESVMIASQNIKQKLLGQETFTHQQTQLKYYEESHQAYVKDIVDNWEDKEVETKALAKLDYGLAFANPAYDANWLGTPQAIDNVIKWSSLDRMVIPIKDSMRDKWNDKDWRNEQHDQLMQLFKDQEEKFYEVIFSAPEIFTRHKGFSSWKTKDEDKYDSLFVEDRKFHGWSNFTMNFAFLHDVKYPWKDNLCPRCEMSKTKYYHHINIRSWQQLLILMGKSTKDRHILPQMYRCYQAHNRIPYKGNSILDNTHPYTSLRDPFSSDNPNGLYSRVLICGNCRVELEKKHRKYDKPILIDEKSGDIMSIDFDPSKKSNHGHVLRFGPTI